MDFNSFLGSPAGIAVQGAAVAAALDFVVGTAKALADGTFAVDAVAAWLRKHILGRVFPITVLCVVSYATGNAVATATAAAGLTTYAIETMGSIYASLALADKSVPTD